MNLQRIHRANAMSLDHSCFHHPDRLAEAYCQKYDRYLCAECIRCREPKNHCKFRTMCMVWEWEKHGLPPELQPPTDQIDADPQDEKSKAEGSG